MKLHTLALCTMFALAAPTAFSQSTNSPAPPADLTQLALEDLLQVEVMSVSRTAEKLSTAPAAITVITGDDIKRSGALSIPEALRLAPGVQVARVTAHTWAVSARGFNDVFANKLLVMVDGRTVYTPLFSGVFWDTQDVLLEDVDRIEVIRGPGATLWGANAVNGVINVITKSAKETQGVMFSAGGGTEEVGFSSVRYGMKLSDTLHARVYGKYFYRDDFRLPSGTDANDAWWSGQGGFRLDWEPTDSNVLTVQGDVYAGNLNDSFVVPTAAPPFATVIHGDSETHGGNLLARWTHSFSDESEMQWQAYFDETTRNTAIYSEERRTGDLDFQHQFTVGERNRLMWGGGYRRTEDEAENTPFVSLFPAKRSLDLVNAFLQDEITIVPDHFALTIGSKFEHNDFTGFEVQPSARAAWTPRERHAIWAAVSRAVRTPSRAEDDVMINPAGVPPGFAPLIGNRSFESEELIAYEIGYRVQPLDHLSLDLAVFYNDYDDLRTLDPLTPFPIGPARVANNLEGETYGFELAAMVQLSDHWKVQGGYSYLQMQMHRKDGSLDFGSERNYEDASPHHQVFARSSVDFGRQFDHGHEFQFDAIVRYVDTVWVGGITIPSYITGDLRLAWRPAKNWEFAVVGQNLLEAHHAEFNSTTIATQRTEVERGVYGKVTWRF